MANGSDPVFESLSVSLASSSSAHLLSTRVLCGTSHRGGPSAEPGKQQACWGLSRALLAFPVVCLSSSWGSTPAPDLIWLGRPHSAQVNFVPEARSPPCPPKDICPLPEPVSGTLFGKRVLADVITLRILQ